MKVSVCMASYNGEKYIKSQISSILDQLGNNDELIISDDGSSDQTINIIESFNDERIILLNHKQNKDSRKNIYAHYLVSSNFENALKSSSGDFIFLADQDDIWVENKLDIMLPYLKQYSTVMSDCSIFDEKNVMISDSFFNNNINLPRGLFLNISKPLYHGCCMAFNKAVLDLALPFPKKMILHDNWIGILSERFGTVKFIDDKLVKYRRHYENSSFSQGKSKNTIIFKIRYRLELFSQVLKRIISIKIKRKFINNMEHKYLN
ncbi:glycosyltransferase family 2 protein [Flavobacterium ustbae]|uniref:glycosyltransferase family 2 protein n=1 Tax=Flavobacterium ustbae TaxID=2488790 RepID=UPI0019CFCE0F|nr:glycosyltransferase family 2 protein [Flavobacterium ustbae]